MNFDKELLTAVEKMPAFPKSVQRVLELTRQPDTAPKVIVGVIEKDPVMTARILRVLNSAFYGLPSQVTGVDHAVVMLGINTIKNLAIRIAAVGMIPQANDAGFDTNRYLLHSLGCAEAAKLIAQKLDDADPSEAYIVGLLHDIGKILFALYLPHPFRAALDESAANGVPLHEAEQAALGVDHTTAGALLAKRWEFPESLVECIRNHHQAPPLGGTGRALFLANQLMKECAFGDAGNPHIVPLPPGLGGALGADYAAIARSLAGLDDVLEQASSYAGMKEAA